MKEFLIIRSTISSPLLKKVLFRGFAIAFLGIILLLLAGIFIPPVTLRHWGWILFLLSLSLITFGLLPYRRLSRLQLKPNELVLDHFHQLTFYSKGQAILTFPLQSIVQANYIDHPQQYGIAIWMKDSIVVHLPKEVKKLQRQGQQIAQANLFLPYFNRHAYDELMEWLEEEKF